MRKVSAHYYLRPDGLFGKRPIISFDDNGMITNVRELGSDFKEEPSLEYYPGIIVPGFVAATYANAALNVSDVRRNGVLRLKRGDVGLLGDEYLSAWDSLLKHHNDMIGSENLATFLLKHTSLAASAIKEPEWGVICEGAKPGLLVLQNIDLRSFSCTLKTSFKILQK